MAGATPNCSVKCCSAMPARCRSRRQGATATTSAGCNARTIRRPRPTGAPRWRRCRSRPGLPRCSSASPAQGRANGGCCWTLASRPAWRSLPAPTKSRSTPCCRRPGCCCCNATPASAAWPSAPPWRGAPNNWRASNSRWGCSSIPCRSSPRPATNAPSANGCRTCRRSTWACASMPTRRCSTCNAGPATVARDCSTAS
ncbi:hypothetical protein D3C76_520150 [compost metagenome]